jgi:hypothetical protein
LDNGYGIRFDGAPAVPFELRRVRRDASFTVVFTKLLSGAKELDALRFDDPAKALLELCKTFQDEFFKSDNLASLSVITVAIGDVGPVQNLEVESYNYLTVSCDFSASYFEDIT